MLITDDPLHRGTSAETINPTWPDGPTDVDHERLIREVERFLAVFGSRALKLAEANGGNGNSDDEGNTTEEGKDREQENEARRRDGR